MVDGRQERRLHEDDERRAAIRTPSPHFPENSTFRSSGTHAADYFAASAG